MGKIKTFFFSKKKKMFFFYTYIYTRIKQTTSHQKEMKSCHLWQQGWTLKVLC